jgi:uncharacterized protein with von Willebrand factor type A (vWA) domain
VAERLTLRVAGRLVLLTAGMRAAGAGAGFRKMLRARRALAAADRDDRASAYVALRAVLCSRGEDVAAFDALFAHWIVDVVPHDNTGRRAC